jgi:oxygen-independent coproporphyrinogen-3 oxidase
MHETTEITLEVNPGTVTDEKIAAWTEVGINRLSIGVQSLKDSVLKNLNRHQSAADVFAVLNRVGTLFPQVSVDLILGLPGVDDDEWKALINTVVTWPITHLSVYFLTVHEQTPLYFRVHAGDLALPCDDRVVDLYYWTRNTLLQHGLQQYEISSFARTGQVCRHNSVYWDRKPYKGFGLGAHSFDGTTRYQNEKNIMQYMRAITHAADATVVAETLSRQQMHQERVMLGLRRVAGISLKDVCADLLPDEQEGLKKRMSALVDQGWLQQEDEWLRLTPKGLSVEHHIAVQLSC